MPASSTSTRCYYGMTWASVGDVGGNKPPMVDGVLNASGDLAAILSTASAAKARIIIRPTGSINNYLTNGAFDMAKWKTKFDIAVAKVSAADMAVYIRNGVMVAHYMTDDFSPGAGGTNPLFPGGCPTYADIEEMARYTKEKWPGMPCTARAPNQIMKTMAATGSATSYLYYDFGWNQWHKKWLKGGVSVQAWFQNGINDGKDVGIGLLCGFNLLNGGIGTAPWNLHPDQGGNSFGMSPTEITTITDAFAAVNATPSSIGLNGWAADPTFDSINYYGMTAIQSALLDMANRTKVQVAGPYNQRGSVVVTPPDDVVGDWALVSSGFHYRTGDADRVNLSLPTTIAENQLIGALIYSRDTSRTAVRPTGWTEAARVSGHSLRGGELTLFVKLAAGTEGGDTVAVDFTGAGGGGVNVMGQSFLFSGNTTVAATLINAVSSDTSWPRGSSNMGPVAGLTPTKSGSMVLICAAKTNDFANGDPPALTTMSATTHDTESWTRMAMVTNVSGDDAGIFLDYAPLTGSPLVTKKSWTQDTGAGSNSSGAGCGFMVAFSPAATPAAVGIVPIIVDLPDTTIILTTTFSLTFSVVQGTIPITWALTTTPAGATFNTSTGAFSWTPTAVGSTTIEVTATNAYGTDTEQFTITVIGDAGGGTNSAPVITHPGNMTVDAQTRLTFQLAATDADGDTLSYTLDTPSPTGATIDKTTGLFTWLPSDDQAPISWPVVALVTDGLHESASTFTITVREVVWHRESERPIHTFLRF